jgi:hypothetical protein
MAAIELEAGTVETAREMLTMALNKKNSQEALKICEDFELEVFAPAFSSAAHTLDRALYYALTA